MHAAETRTPMRALPTSVFLAVIGCSSASGHLTGSDAGTKGAGGTAGSGGASQSGGGAAGAGDNTGGKPTQPDASVASGGTSATTHDAGTPDTRTPDGPIVHGGPGCGLAAAAFCDTFDAPAKTNGRAGELDSRRWSAGRLAPQLPSGNGCAIGIGPGTLPTCRDGLPKQVYPDKDSLICDPMPGTDGGHLLVVTAAQNYGQNSYRIRQPFDFAGRTGKVVFDAEGFTIGGLLGWISLEITEDPVNAPCFSVGAAGVNNNEGSLVPRNAVEIQFQNQCGGYSSTPAVSLSMIDVLHEYQDTILAPKTPTCVATERNRLNHFEIAISQTHIEVSATPFSTDGKSFGPSQVLYSTDANVPFSRGWVQITTHNHATLKYSGPNSGFGAPESLDDWTARWDNVGFDGPVVSGFREYEIADSLTPGTNAWNRMGPIVNVGYLMGDAKDPPKNVLHFSDVDTNDVESARLSLSGWYLNQSDKPLDTYVLRYRLNGKTWRERPFTAGELGLLGGTHTQGQLGQIIDVPVGDLVQGDNTLEFTTVNVPQNYPPIAANIDLVLSTK